jgi:hypothetical protein
MWTISARSLSGGIGPNSRTQGGRPAEALADGRVVPSEIMTILIGFHQSHYRNFKAYYLEHVCQYQRWEFPGLVS